LVPYVPKEDEIIVKPETLYRHGNVAEEKKRPLYEEGPNWAFDDYKKSLLEKA
jgi:hypothetical protein